MLISEGGATWAPFVGDRLNEAYRQHPMFDDGRLPKPPKEYMMEQVYASFQHDETAVPAFTSMGFRNILFGTDYPHIEGTYPHTQKVLHEILDGVDDDVSYRIRIGSFLELFPSVGEPAAYARASSGLGEDPLVPATVAGDVLLVAAEVDARVPNGSSRPPPSRARSERRRRRRTCTCARSPTRGPRRHGPEPVHAGTDHDDAVTEPELRGPHDAVRVAHGVDDLEAERVDEEVERRGCVGVIEVRDDLRRVSGRLAAMARRRYSAASSSASRSMSRLSCHVPSGPRS